MRLGHRAPAVTVRQGTACSRCSTHPPLWLPPAPPCWGAAPAAGTPGERGGPWAERSVCASGAGWWRRGGRRPLGPAPGPGRLLQTPFLLAGGLGRPWEREGGPLGAAAAGVHCWGRPATWEGHLRFQHHAVVALVMQLRGLLLQGACDAGGAAGRAGAGAGDRAIVRWCPQPPALTKTCSRHQVAQQASRLGLPGWPEAPWAPLQQRSQHRESLGPDSSPTAALWSPHQAARRDRLFCALQRLRWAPACSNLPLPAP